MTDIVDKLRESYSHLNRDEAITSNSVDTIQKAVSEIKRLRFERDQLKTAAGIDEWCRQFERANITLNERLFAMHERLEKTEAERDRLRDALKDIESPSIDIVCHGSWEAFEWAMERAAEALKENDQ